jgi:hypothetical protein
MPLSLAAIIKIDMKRHYLIIIILITILISCKKEDEINCRCAGLGDIIKIGDTIKANYGHVPHDIKSYYVSDEAGVDFKQDDSPFFGNQLRYISSSVDALVNCEILADTSLKFIREGVDTIFLKKVSPLILEYKDIIGSNGYWTKNSLVFAYSTYIFKGSPDLGPTNQVYPGWNNIGDKYFAFREIMVNDTVYGWFNVSIQNYAIIVHSYAKF